MPLWVDAFLGSNAVASMTTAEVGAYLVLLMRAWKGEPAATIPGDDQTLARWTGMTTDEWSKAKPSVLRPWIAAGNGRFLQPRLKREWDRVQEASKQKQAAGRAGAEKRWHRHSAAMPPPLADAWQTDSTPDVRVQSSESRVQNTKPKPEQGAESRELAKTPPAAPRQRLTFVPLRTTWDAGLGFLNITPERKAMWASAYPACDIDRQLAAMNAWLVSNPRKAVKHNWDRFITNWLMRSQDRGGDAKSNTPSHSNGTQPPEPTAADVRAFLGGS